MEQMKNYRLWLEQTQGNEELHAELERIQNDPAAIEDRFYRDLAFGTGGLRGVLGAGTNRMNIHRGKGDAGLCKLSQQAGR